MDMVVAGEREDDDVGEGRVVDVREDDKAVRGRFNPINDVFVVVCSSASFSDILLLPLAMEVEGVDVVVVVVLLSS